MIPVLSHDTLGEHPAVFSSSSSVAASSSLVQPATLNFSVPYSPPRNLHRAVVKSLVDSNGTLFRRRQLFFGGPDKSAEDSTPSVDSELDGEVDQSGANHPSNQFQRDVSDDESSEDNSRHLLASTSMFPDSPVGEAFLAESALSSRPQFVHDFFNTHEDHHMEHSLVLQNLGSYEADLSRSEHSSNEGSAVLTPLNSPPREARKHTLSATISSISF